LTSFVVCLDGQLYSGTVSDFSGLDALIIKDQIRTEQSNLKHLNGELRKLRNYLFNVLTIAVFLFEIGLRCFG
jgi:hypothetical protein